MFGPSIYDSILVALMQSSSRRGGLRHQVLDDLDQPRVGEGGEFRMTETGLSGVCGGKAAES